MKRNLLLWAVCAVMMAFTACTQEKVVYVEGENDMSSSMQLEGNVLKISLSNGLSRAVRPIYDNEATNNINRIGFKFLDQTGQEVEGITIEQVTVSGDGNVIIINETEKEQAQEEAEGAGETVEGQNFYPGNIVKISNDGYDYDNATLSIYLNMEAAKGQRIRIIAYGYNDAGDESAPALEITSDDSYGERLLKLESATNDNLPEYFAGYEDVAVNIYGLFDKSPEIVLERQVAGLLVYLEKIPAYVNREENDPVQVGYITVSAAKEIAGLVIPAKAMDKDRISGDNYANGLSGQTKSCELLRFDLRSATVNGLFYEFDNNTSVGGTTFENRVLFADEMEGIASQFSGKNFANHTLFGSCFILPFDHPTYSIDTSTALQINYLDESGSLIKSVQLHMQVEDGSSNSYSIWANHFYSIGTKNGNATDDSDGDGYPDDGNGDKDNDEPASGNDDPLDISDPSGTRILTLTVNDTWEDVSLIRPTSTGGSD